MRMTRLTLALTVWLGFVAVTSASLAPRKDPSPFEKAPQARVSQPQAQAPEQTARPAAKSEYVVTEGTEILLNGRPCKYEDVPARASIVRMELAADNKTVLKVHFRTRK
jgi:hypothetical protein